MADCGNCSKRVTKTAKALACDCCKLWYHMSCARLTDDDYEFMKNRKGFGFRWFCSGCVGGADSTMGTNRSTSQVDEKLSSIIDAVNGLSRRMDNLESRNNSSEVSSPETFADVIKKTVKEVRKSEDLDMRVTDHGHTKIIKNEEVLVLKPRCLDETQATPSAVSLDGLRNILKTVPVKSCRETGRGNVVVKFPNAKAKEDAKVLVESATNFQDVAISEPRKMLPKMTLLDIPPSLSDSEIVSGILEKNPSINRLVDTGNTLTLVFSRVRDGKKMAVIKMSPAVRTAIVKNSIGCS